MFRFYSLHLRGGNEADLHSIFTSSRLCLWKPRPLRSLSEVVGLLVKLVSVTNSESQSKHFASLNGFVPRVLRPPDGNQAKEIYLLQLLAKTNAKLLHPDPVRVCKS